MYSAVSFDVWCDPGLVMSLYIYERNNSVLKELIISFRATRSNDFSETVMKSHWESQGIGTSELSLALPCPSWIAKN